MVLASFYPDVASAEADYEAVKALYHEIRTSHDFDAAIISRDEDGKVHVIKKHEQPTRHGAAHGLGWGQAVGAVCAIFPAVGLLGPGRRGRGGRGDRRRHRPFEGRHARSRPQGARRGARAGPGWSACRLRDEHGRPDGGERQGVNKYVSQEIDAQADALARQLKEAEATS
jgi:hypothetical protein